MFKYDALIIVNRGAKLIICVVSLSFIKARILTFALIGPIPSVHEKYIILHFHNYLGISISGY